MRRRTYLRTSGALGGALLAGCANPFSTGGGADGPRMFMVDAANTGYDDGIGGPRSAVAPTWVASEPDHVFGTPAVVDGTVYAAAKGGDVYALDAGDGGVEWRFESDAGPRRASHGSWYDPPAVAGGTVYASATGDDGHRLHAIDAADGSERWSVAADARMRTPTATDGTVVVVERDTAESDGRLIAYDADDGSERWSVDRLHILLPTPAVADGTVYVTSRVGDEDDVEDGHPGDALVSGFSLDDGSEQLAVAFDRSLGTRSPAVDDDTLYFGTGETLHAISTETGAERWRISRDYRLFRNPTVADDTIFVAALRPRLNDMGLITGYHGSDLFAFDRRDGSERWATSWERPVSPAVATTDAVYVAVESTDFAVEGFVAALDRADGRELWTSGGPFSTWHPPAVTDDAVYVGSPVGSDARSVFALSPDGEPLASDPASATDPPERGHPTYRYDAVRTGAAPEGAGVAGDAETVWSATAIARRTGGGLAVLDGTVYAAGTDRLFAATVADGARQWEYAVPRSPVVSAPVTDGESVFVGTNDSGIRAVRAADGVEHWRVDVGDRAVTEPPVLRDGTLYAVVAAEDDADVLLALDPATGEEHERRSLGASDLGGLVATGGAVLVGTDDGVVALSPDLTSERWAVPIDSLAVPTPIVGDGTVFAAGSRTVDAIDLDSGDRRWRDSFYLASTSTYRTARATVAYSDGTLFVGNETLRALDADDGRTRWERDLERLPETQLTVAGDRVYAPVMGEERQSGSIRVFDASSGTEVTSFGPFDDFRAPPVVVDDGLFVRTSTRIHRIASRDATD